jgi:hypothetical protein
MHWTAASRTRQVSTTVTVSLVRDSGRVLNGAPQFLGMREGGATVADRRLPGAPEQKVRIFCLLGFVEDRRQIRFSRGSLPRFFLHGRVLRVKPTLCNLRQKGNACSFCSSIRNSHCI